MSLDRYHVFSMLLTSIIFTFVYQHFFHCDLLFVIFLQAYILKSGCFWFLKTYVITSSLFVHQTVLMIILTCELSTTFQIKSWNLLIKTTKNLIKRTIRIKQWFIFLSNQIILELFSCYFISSKHIIVIFLLNLVI